MNKHKVRALILEKLSLEINLINKNFKVILEESAIIHNISYYIRILELDKAIRSLVKWLTFLLTSDAKATNCK